MCNLSRILLNITPGLWSNTALLHNNNTQKQRHADRQVSIRIVTYIINLNLQSKRGKYLTFVKLQPTYSNRHTFMFLYSSTVCAKPPFVLNHTAQPLSWLGLPADHIWLLNLSRMKCHSSISITLLTVFTKQLGSLYTQGGGLFISLSVIHIFSPHEIFHFSSLLSSGVFFILTSQPVNLRSLDSHLSTPRHGGA